MSNANQAGIQPGFEIEGLPQVLIAGISRDAPGTKYKLHTVKHLEINYISSGLSVCKLNGQPFLNAAGHIYMYWPGDVYEGQGDAAKGPYVCRWVRFTWPGWDSDASVQPIGKKLILARATLLGPQARRELQAAFDALLEVHDAGQPGWQIGASGHLLALISILLREQSRNSAGATENASLDRRLAQACAFMEQHLARRMKMAEVAHVARLSEDYFARIFRQRLGQAPLQYLIRLRVQEGRRLLVRDPGLTIREASRRAGFEDAKHFSRLFHKHFGMTPDRFRRQLVSRFHSEP